MHELFCTWAKANGVAEWSNMDHLGWIGDPTISQKPIESFRCCTLRISCVTI